MTLWNIIRDFLVQHIFGGVDSAGVAHNGNIIGADTTSTQMTMQIGNITISLSDWLSTTLTIVVLLALCFFLYLCVRWVFRLVSGLIK